MAIAKKALVWGLFAAGGTLTAFVLPVLIALLLLVALGQGPDGLQYHQIHPFASSWYGKIIIFAVIFLSLWHAAHRLRVVFHDVGVRKDSLIATVLYLAAGLGSVLTLLFLVRIG